MIPDALFTREALLDAAVAMARSEMPSTVGGCVLMDALVEAGVEVPPLPVRTPPRFAT